MSYTLEDMSVDLQALGQEINNLIKDSHCDDYDDLSGLSGVDYGNIEHRFLINEYRSIMDKLQDSLYSISYLNRPVAYEGPLFKNNLGRYESKDGHEYTSGSGIEAKIYDDFEERYDWVHASVEHNGTDYYIVGHSKVKMDGLTVRRRKFK